MEMKTEFIDHGPGSIDVEIPKGYTTVPEHYKDELEHRCGYLSPKHLHNGKEINDWLTRRYLFCR